MVATVARPQSDNAAGNPQLPEQSVLLAGYLGRLAKAIFGCLSGLIRGLRERNFAFLMRSNSETYQRCQSPPSSAAAIASSKAPRASLSRMHARSGEAAAIVESDGALNDQSAPHITTMDCRSR